MKPEKSEFRVIFQPEGKYVKVPYKATILDAARTAGVDIMAICGGSGKCGKCRVIVKYGRNLNPLTEAERTHLCEHEILMGYRLACQTLITEDLIIVVPEESRTGKQRLQVEGIEVPVKVEPCVRKFFR